MTFQTPAGLFLLAAVPLAAWLLLRRLRRRDRIVAAFFLLRDLVDSLPPFSRSHLVRRKLQSLLLLAAIACAGLAAGGPVLGRADDPPQRAVILVDGLRGEGAAGGSGTRDPVAKTVEGLLRPLRSDDRVVLLRTDTGILGGGLLTPRQALRLIRSEQPTMVYGEPEAAADLAALAERAHAATRVWVVTHDAERWRPLVARRGGAWRIVAAPHPAFDAVNRAILEVEVRPDFLRPGRVAVFCRACVFGPTAGNTGEAVLTVAVDGRMLARRSFSPVPGQPHGEVFPELEAGTGLLTIEITPTDSFPADNTFTAPLREAGAVHVLLVAEENRPIEAALRALPGVRLTVMRPRAGATEPPAAVRVYDGSAPRDMSGNLFVISPPEGIAGAGYRGSAPAPRVVRADPTHFLLAGVTLDGLRASRLPIYELGSGLEAIASADGHPLLAAGRVAHGPRLALLAVDPADTVWTYTPSFPILVANVISWLAESPEGAHSSFLVGDTLPEALAREIRSVTGPEGTAATEPRGGWGKFRFTRAGRWRLQGRSADTTGEVFVNILDERVSAAMALSPGGPAAATPGESDAPGRPFRAAAQSALLLAAVALLALGRLVAPRARSGRLV